MNNQQSDENCNGIYIFPPIYPGDHQPTGRINLDRYYEAMNNITIEINPNENPTHPMPFILHPGNYQPSGHIGNMSRPSDNVNNTKKRKYGVFLRENSEESNQPNR